jgi:hypothetical protein
VILASREARVGNGRSVLAEGRRAGEDGNKLEVVPACTRVDSCQ